MSGQRTAFILGLALLAPPAAAHEGNARAEAIAKTSSSARAALAFIEV